MKMMMKILSRADELSRGEEVEELEVWSSERDGVIGPKESREEK